MRPASVRKSAIFWSFTVHCIRWSLDTKSLVTWSLYTPNMMSWPLSVLTGETSSGRQLLSMWVFTHTQTHTLLNLFLHTELPVCRCGDITSCVSAPHFEQDNLKKSSASPRLDDIHGYHRGRRQSAQGQSSFHYIRHVVSPYNEDM